MYVCICVYVVSLFHSQTCTNPATPEASYENPATPVNFRVDSPHSSYTNPFIPGSTRTPLYHSDYTAPSPLASITPSPANSYDSPGMINPLTPGANYDGMCSAVLFVYICAVSIHMSVHLCECMYINIHQYGCTYICMYIACSSVEVIIDEERFAGLNVCVFNPIEVFMEILSRCHSQKCLLFSIIKERCLYL